MDILDISRSRIYCPGRIIAINNSSYTISYRGWGPEHDETLTDFSLLSPAYTHVFKRKAWIKLSERLGWWPGIAYLRSAYTDDPKDLSGVDNLRHTNLLFVEPIFPEHKSAYKCYRGGYWAMTSKVSPISRQETLRRSAGLNNKAIVEDFMHSLRLLDNEYAHISSEPFVLEGSLLVSPVNDLTSDGNSVVGKRVLAGELSSQRPSGQPHISASSTPGSIGNADGKTLATCMLIDAIKIGYNDIRHRYSNKGTEGKNIERKARWTIQGHYNEVIRSDVNDTVFWDRLHFGAVN